MHVGSIFDFHTGIHAALVEGLRTSFSVSLARATIRCYSDDSELHPVESFTYTRVNDFPPDARFIYSAFYAVANEVPWVVDMDDICLPLYHSNCFKPDIGHILAAPGPDERVREVVRLRLGAYATPHCRGILFRSRDGLVRAAEIIQSFGLAETAEARAFLDKAVVAYPSIPLRVNVDERQFKSAVPRVLFMARDYHEKGGDVALATFARLLERRANVELIYIGPVPQAEQSRHASTLSRIRYAPLVSHPEAQRALAASDILLLPTHSESFGFSLVESMAAACVPVTYTGPRTTVIREIVDDGETGILLEEPDEQDDLDGEAERFCQAVLSLLDDSTRHRAMRSRAVSECSEGRFSVAKKRDLLQNLFLTPMQTSTVEPSHLRLGYRAFRTEDFNRMVDNYRQQHQIARCVNI